MSSSMKRKMKRKADKKKKKVLKKELDQKINLYEQMPDSCLSCDAKFDKQDKSSFDDWYVVVREAENQVNLYCPTCWKKARSIIEGFESNMA